MKIDLHVHSKHSRRPSLWLLKKIGCPESFTEPTAVYRIARQRGMSHVTITDHNTIDGCLSIAGLPNTFISEEVTTYFPEDRCKIHVLVYDIDETDHRDIQEARENIFDLAALLRERSIRHAVAHPLAAVNDRLTIDHFEKLLLLFRVFELNGDQDRRVNAFLREMLSGLRPVDIERLADAHGMEPAVPVPWEKGIVAGSDDHCSLTIAETGTEVNEARSVDAFFDGVEQGLARTVLRECTPRTVGRNIYAIAYSFFKRKFDMERYAGKDILVRFLEQSLQSDPVGDESLWARLCCAWNRRRASAPASAGASAASIIRREASRLISEDPRLMAIVENSPSVEARGEGSWFEFVDRVSNKMLFRFGNTVLDRLVDARLFDLFHSIGSAAALYTLLAPYFVSFGIFSAERRLAEKAARRLGGDFGGDDGDGPRVAHFTDTFYEVNGVARTLQQQVRCAAAAGKNLTMFTFADGEVPAMRNVRNFRPVGVYSLPEYPEQKLAFPPFLETLDFCFQENYTHFHAATPGPVGLTALAVARILKRPVFGTYHTALPQYANILTEDASMEEIMWRYMVWFYQQTDMVWVSSKASREELAGRGVSREKIRIFPRGVDTGRFSPEKRSDLLGARWSVPEGKRLLYVGRVSREKDLPRLVEIFGAVLADHPDAHLVVVGDGPYLEEMRSALSGAPCTFTGYLDGDELPQIYASCNLFVFPSMTDTFGNVVLEAQACGTPVVVSDMGGPQENIVPRTTGLVCDGGDTAAFVDAVSTLLSDPDRLRTMGAAAREYMEQRSFDAAFDAAWRMYGPGPFETPQPSPEQKFIEDAAASMVGAGV